MKKLLSALLACTILLAGCGRSLAQYKNTTLTAGFDTAILLLGYCEDQDEFDRYFNEMHDLFADYNELFDRYHDYDGVHNIKTINDSAGTAPVEVDPAIIDMLLLAKEYYEISHGAFDITQGKMLAIWHHYREAGIEENSMGNYDPPVPTQEELEEAYVEDGWSHVQIDEENRTVYIDDPSVALDVGGIAKGYATELVAKKLQEDGLAAGAVNGGGNVRLIGLKPDGTPWSIGILQPNDTSSYVGTFYLDAPASLVTSGDYQRYYESGGVMYSHIIDPSTLQPARRYRSVTVLAEDSGVADCLSTALFILPQNEGEQIIDEYNSTHDDQIGAYWVYEEEPEGLDAQLVEGYYVYASEGIRPYLDIYGATGE